MLEQSLRIMSLTHLLQESQIVFSIAFKRLLPSRTIIHVTKSMTRLVSCRNEIDLLDSLSRCHLDEIVVCAIKPVDGKIDDDEGLVVAIVQP